MTPAYKLAFSSAVTWLVIVAMALLSAVIVSAQPFGLVNVILAAAPLFVAWVALAINASHYETLLDAWDPSARAFRESKPCWHLPGGITLGRGFSESHYSADEVARAREMLEGRQACM